LALLLITSSTTTTQPLEREREREREFEERGGEVKGLVSFPCNELVLVLVLVYLKSQDTKKEKGWIYLVPLSLDFLFSTSGLAIFTQIKMFCMLFFGIDWPWPGRKWPSLCFGIIKRLQGYWLYLELLGTSISAKFSFGISLRKAQDSFIYIYMRGIDFSSLTTRTPCVMGLEAMAKFQQEQTAVNSRHVASARVFTLRPDGFAFFCALQVVPPLDRDPFPSCQVCASW